MKALKKFSKRFYVKQIIVCVQVYLLVVLGPLCGSVALATPNNPNVVLGSTEPIATGNTTTVNLISERAVINWQGLDTSDGQQLIFDKSGASGAYFAVLNRVTGGGATQFDGMLNGNGGHVIIVNPQGIVFGSTAVINAFKFTASGLGISSADYTNWYNGSGQLNFTSGSGNVINNSVDGISAEQVRLIGKNVSNNGAIRTTSPDGLVLMAAGEKVYLAESGSNVFVDTTWSASDNAVTNTGTLDAEDGTIRLASGDIFSQAAIEGAESFVAEAQGDVTISAPVDAGSVELIAGRHITLEEDATIHTEGDVYLWADEIGDTQGDFLSQDGADITADAGNVTIKGNEVVINGAVKAGIDESGEATPDKDLTITGRDCWGGDETEWRNVWAYDTLEASRDIIISDTGETEIATWVPDKCGYGHWEYSTEYDPGTINLFGDVTAGRNLELYNDTYTGPDVTLEAGNNIILANDGLETTPPGHCEQLTGDEWLALKAGNEIVAPDTVISVTGSTLVMEQGPSINLDSFNFANQANTDLTLISDNGSVTAVDTGTKPENAADKWNTIGATANDDITLSGDGSIKSGDSGTDPGKSLWAKSGNIDVDAGGDFKADKDIEAGTDISATAGDDIILKGGATAGCDITLTANDNVIVKGDLDAGRDVEVTSSSYTTYLGGNVYAGRNAALNNNTWFTGWDDQLVDAGGTITAGGVLRKLNYDHSLGWSDGSLYLHAGGDISLADNVTAAICCPEECWSAGGGVSIISDNGRISTPGFEGALAINITGRSDHFEGVGVTLPYDPEGPGRAAIVIQSADDLVLHKWADLSACGRYYEPEPVDDSWSVDDRPGVGFLAEPATIGGHPRDQGEPFDAAIYVGSKSGNVHVGAEVDIRSGELVPGDGQIGVGLEIQSIESDGRDCVRRGAMIVDAHDTVTLGDKFEGSLSDGRVGDRLEVASRITEWLEDAVGRLPFPEDLDLPENYNYVMRGAGLENEDISDGRAWVLEDEFEPFAEAAPIQEPEMKFAGCPALVNWLAGELDLNADQVQVLFAGARGVTYDIQPCDTCARLQSAALVLMDSDGSRLAALAKVISEYASAGTPPSEEQMAMIAAALENPGEGTDYALAGEWLDAMTQYVTILDSELGLATEDAVAAADKYVSPVTASDNTALAGFVSAQLAAIGG